jgi:hypothetical protein
MRWVVNETLMGGMTNAYKTLVGKLEGKLQFWEPRRRWEDNIKIDLKKLTTLGGCGMDSSALR